MQIHKIDSVLRLYEPDEHAMPCPVVFDSPHSGAMYPADFDHVCPHKLLKQAEDTAIDQLFMDAPKSGATLLAADFPRTYIDANRAVDDIDPLLLDGPAPIPIKPTDRSSLGIGLVRRLCKPGVPMYAKPLSWDAVQRRINGYYTPYHTTLSSILDRAHYNFGMVWHINCHSMPASTAPIVAGGRMADFVLGDHDGQSCDVGFTLSLQTYLQGLGYTVALNNPFKGVELTERYSDPGKHRHSLQLEMNKSLYMMADEVEIDPAKYAALQASIRGLIGYVTAYARDMMVPMAAD